MLSWYLTKKKKNKKKADNTEYLLKKITTEKYKGMYVQTDK